MIECKDKPYPMKINLSARLISACWLSLLSLLFVSSLMSFPHERTTFTMLAAIIIIVSYFIFGYLHGYKILLLPADQMNIFPLRCVAAIWTGSLAGAIVFLLSSRFIPENAQVNLPVIFISVLSASIVGGLFFYKILLLPTVQYKKNFPSISERNIASIYFGLSSYLVSIIVFRDISGAIPIFVLFLAGYLGFVYGYRILLLTFSAKSVLKVAVFAFIGNAYALFIIIALFLADLFTKFPVLMAINRRDFSYDVVGASCTLLFLIFPIMSLFICTVGIILAGLLFFASRFITKSPR